MDTTKTMPAAGRERRAPDFLRAIVASDLEAGRHTQVVTRFPPEPNGYLHIGHAKSICLNFGIAEDFGGKCHLRFDDTNPETEDQTYVDSIIDSVRWLGFDWGEHLYFAADYFERMYECAIDLIREGKAYVDSASEEEIREARGTVTQPGRPTADRDRSIEESLELFRGMRAGEFLDGAHVLRARIDLASPNMLMRDPILYRIRHAHHYRTGDAWCIYPLYDYAHPLEDAFECVTHSICTLEFENNRELYDWVVENAPVPCRPRQYEFARLNLDYTVMSKRKLLELVNGGHVGGWDDPRLPTIAGLRRRGVTPESIRAFCEMIGVAKTNSRVDIGKLEYAIRDDLNQRAPRVLCVLRPLRVVITNWPQGYVDELDAPYWPHDVPRQGSRTLPFSGELLIDRDDFMEDPPKGFHRLAPGREVRLRYGYVIRCDDVVKNDAGEIVELRCRYDPGTRGGATPDGRTVKGTLHWVSAAHALPCEVRLYERLLRVPDPDAIGDDADWKTYLNPDSLVVLPDARVEPAVRDDPAGSRYQFERLGYFVGDAIDSRPDALVFNRTVTLRDTWAKVSRPGTDDPGRPKRDRPERSRDSSRKQGRSAPASKREARSADEEARVRRLSTHPDLPRDLAAILGRDASAAKLFEDAVAAGAGARSTANWIINEIPRELAGGDLASLRFGGETLARLIALLESGTLSSTGGREVLAILVREGGDPETIVGRKGLNQVSDASELEPVIADVIARNTDKAEAYRAGKTGLLGFFMGQVMAGTNGRANPEVVKKLLAERLA
ncbi:MAG: glutamine--tRNA ligase/YqeY domain fusion protein [Longimicrobiales bacterium]